MGDDVRRITAGSASGVQTTDVSRPLASGGGAKSQPPAPCQSGNSIGIRRPALNEGGVILSIGRITPQEFPRHRGWVELVYVVVGGCVPPNGSFGHH
jgi:hypothetical protein